MSSAAVLDDDQVALRLTRIFHQGRARVGCDAVRWQGRSRGFKPHAACLRSDPCLQAWVRPARVTTVSTEDAQVRTARAREAETGQKKSLRTVCACRGPKPLALAEQRRRRAVAQLNRVCSAGYKLDLAPEAEKVSIHEVLRGIEERPGEISGLNHARAVIPAKAGIQGLQRIPVMASFATTAWIPAFAGMTGLWDKVAQASTWNRTLADSTHRLLVIFKLKDALHNSSRTVAARTRAVYGVVFLPNSRAIGCKKRLVAHPDPRHHSLARVMQSILKGFSHGW